MTVATSSYLDERSAAYVDAVVAATDAHAPVVEAFLVGSAAAGGFDPATSDLDLVVVVEEPPVDRAALVAAVAGLERPVRNLELVVYVEGAQPPDVELNVSDGEERPDEPRFWFLIDAALAQERAVPVAHGCAWGDLFEPITPERLREAMQESLEWSQAQPAGDEFARVNAVRARRYLEHGEWITKKEATP